MLFLDYGIRISGYIIKILRKNHVFTVNLPTPKLYIIQIISPDVILIQIERVLIGPNLGDPAQKNDDEQSSITKVWLDGKHPLIPQCQESKNTLPSHAS